MASHKGEIYIERMIIWRGKPHIWHFWGTPKDLIHGDKVIQGHENLPTNHPLKHNKNAIYQQKMEPQLSVTKDKLPVLGKDLGRHKKPQKIYEVTHYPKTDREKQLFADIFDKFTPEHIETFRTLGICAGDNDSSDFLFHFHTEYINQLYTTKVEQAAYYQKPKNILDILSEDESNAVGQGVSTALQTSIVNEHNSSSSFNDLFVVDNWIKPIQNIPENIINAWKKDYDSDAGSLTDWINEQRYKYCQEKSGTFSFMRECVDRLKLHNEYTQLADEYSIILHNYICARNNKDFRMAEFKKQLLDPRFDNINYNLLFSQQAVSNMVYYGNIKGDFMSKFPILTDKDITLLKSHDFKTFYNVVLRAVQVSDEDNSNYIQLYQDMLDTFEIYGDPRLRDKNGHYNGSAAYHIEDNEIKCKISSVSKGEHKRIERLIEKTWDKENHGDMEYKILGVYKVEHLPVEEKFNQVVEQNDKYKNETSGGKNCKRTMLYHGTDYMRTKLILGISGGFKVGKTKTGNLLGTAVYLAEHSSKSAQYIGESFSHNGVSGMLFLNEVSLGNAYELTNEDATRDLDTIEADTLFAPKGVRIDFTAPLLNNEWAVRNPNAIIPRYIIHMELI